MIVNVPFYHEMNVRLPRKVKQTSIAVPDSHPIELQEVHDATLAARIPPSKGRETWIDLMIWDGRLWMPTHQRLGEKDQPFLGVHTILADLQIGGQSRGIFLSSNSHSHRCQRFDSVEEAMPREISYSDRDEKIAEIERRAGDCIIIDGVAHAPVAEPVMVLSISGSQSYVTFKEIDDLKGGRDDMQNVFNLDDWDGLLEDVRDFGFSENSLLPPKTLPPEVMVPDAFSWDREKEWLLESLDTDMRLFQISDFKIMRADTFTHYAGIRDALEAVDRNEDGQLLEIGEKVTAFVKHLAEQNDRHEHFSRTRLALKAFQRSRMTGQYAPPAIDMI